MKTWIGIVLAFTYMAGMASGHSDPRGDVHPVVSVRDGNFQVDFESNHDGEDWDPDSKAVFRSVWSPDGKPILPRHRLHLSPDELLNRERSTWISPCVIFNAGEGGDIHRVDLRTPTLGKEGHLFQPLPMTIRGLASMHEEAATITKQGMVAFTWGNAQSVLHLGLVSKEAFVEGESIPIGKAATIYSFPRVSDPVWAARRWWLAWVKQVDDKSHSDDPADFVTMLTSYDPVTKKLAHQKLPGESTWNTSLSLAATDHWLCAAWHTSNSGGPFSLARTVTAFHRLPDP